MRNRILSGVLSMGLLFGTAMPGAAEVYHHHHYYKSEASYQRHKRNMRTAKRVGIGAVGGGVIGGIAGGGAGVAIGGLAGAGAGAIYDAHKRHHGH